MSDFGKILKMTEEEAWSFIESQKIMSLATVTKKGRPHNTHVWYVVISRKLYVRCEPGLKKIENIMTNPYVSCAIEDGRYYDELRGLMINGTARIVEEKKLVDAVSIRTVKKYAEEMKAQVRLRRDWLEQYKKRKWIAIEITPGKINSWNFRKLVSK